MKEARGEHGSRGAKERGKRGKGDKGTRGKKAKVRRYMDTLTAERLYEIPSGDVSNRRGLILPQPAVIIPHYPPSGDIHGAAIPKDNRRPRRLARGAKAEINRSAACVIDRRGALPRPDASPRVQGTKALAGCSRKKRKGGLSMRTIPLSRPPRRGYPEMISPGGAFQTGPGPAPVL